MPRIRSIKPSFFRSEDVSALPLRARLTWIGLWTQCDDQGRTKDNARLIKGDIWPLDDVSLRDIEEDLVTLAAHGRIVRYIVDGRRYLEIANWRAHQAIQKPTPSKYPSPEEADIDSDSPPVVLPDNGDSTTSRKGKEGRGGEGTRAGTRDVPPPALEPPLRCPEHIEEQAPGPCGPCGDARRTHERWAKTRVEAEQAARSAQARERAEATRAAIDACRDCNPQGYLPSGALCAHDPAAGQRTARGAALARAAISKETTAA